MVFLMMSHSMAIVLSFAIALPACGKKSEDSDKADKRGQAKATSTTPAPAAEGALATTGQADGLAGENAKEATKAAKTPAPALPPGEMLRQAVENTPQSLLDNNRDELKRAKRLFRKVKNGKSHHKNLMISVNETNRLRVLIGMAKYDEVPAIAVKALVMARDVQDFFRKRVTELLMTPPDKLTSRRQSQAELDTALLSMCNAVAAPLAAIVAASAQEASLRSKTFDLFAAEYAEGGAELKEEIRDFLTKVADVESAPKEQARMRARVAELPPVGE